MSMQALQIARAVAFMVFVGVSICVPAHPALIFVAFFPLAVSVGFGFVIHNRKGTYAKRMAWFESTLRRMGDSK